MPVKPKNGRQNLPKTPNCYIIPLIIIKRIFSKSFSQIWLFDSYCRNTRTKADIFPKNRAVTFKTLVSNLHTKNHEKTNEPILIKQSARLSEVPSEWKAFGKKLCFQRKFGHDPSPCWALECTRGDHDLDDLRITVNPKHNQSMFNTSLSLRVQ